MTADVHTLTGAYALDALPEDERREFERHLAQCEACRLEVRELEATAARLGEAVEEPPPPGLRQSVLDAVDQTRQERPDPDSSVVRMPARAPWYQRVAVPAAAVLAILVVGLSVILGNVNARVDQLEASAEVTELLTARELTVSEVTTDTGHARVVAAPSRGEAAFLASGMDQVSEDRTYQLWLMRDGEPTAAGLFRPGEDGQVVRLLTAAQSADAVAVTIEPASGSEQPTMDPIMVVEL